MLENLRLVLTQPACDAIEAEITANVRELFSLGEHHFAFARQTTRDYWRQRISRFYYAAYNARRAIQLDFDGVYRTDVSDHKEIGALPNSFSNRNTYERRLVDLRGDRNLADYDHAADEGDLVLTQEEAENLVADFINDARAFLAGRGVVV